MKTCLALWICLAMTSGALAQDVIDAKLWTAISGIRVIDNHTHADAVDAGRASQWKVANPLGEPRYPDVVPLSRQNPEWRLAWKALYGYSHPDAKLPHLQALLAIKRETLERAGTAWPVNVLDLAGVEVALVNTVKRGPGLDNARFRWVPYADPLLRPFSGNSSGYFYNGGETSAAALLARAGLPQPPPTLGEYVSQVVDATLAHWKREGAVAVKFLSAYGRTLDFDPVSEAEAAQQYEAGADSMELEDYLFNRVAAAAGAHGLVVHIHTGNGDGPFFNNRRADPGWLETAINSRPLRKTNFVLVHGGWPYHLNAQAMMDKPNTYADFSAQTFYLSTHALAEVLRGWLSWHPEKVLFGSDAYSDVDSPLTAWEEKQWLTTYKARRALAIALTAMMKNGEISRDRAVQIARMVLRDNAAKLYGITAP